MCTLPLARSLLLPACTAMVIANLVHVVGRAGGGGGGGGGGAGLEY